MGKQILNGVLYGTGEIIKFSPFIYSSEEREVGVWSDGCPIYEKTIEISNLAMNNGTQVAHNIANFKMCIDLQVRMYDENAEITYGVQENGLGAAAGTTILGFRVNTTNIYCTGNESWSGYPYRTWYFTIQYTKTTDSPGSGKYTTNGGEAVHYSLSEQIVGTWIDQKPLYEKTIDIGYLPNATQKLVNHNIDDIDTVAMIKGSAKNTNNNASVVLPHTHPNGANQSIAVTVTTTQISIQDGIDRSAYYGYVTIQYTKTTD